MSEYQYYEFQALDRPLTEKEISAVRQLSTRAEITDTSFTNEYHYGDFHGNPLDMMKRYYDAHLYFANWGTHTLMLRVPRDVVDVEAMQPYFAGEGLDVNLTKTHVIVEFTVNRDEADWDEVECSLAPLLPLREMLLAGDLRPLYIGWLACLQNDSLEEDAPEAPVPPGMNRLTGPLRALADFLWVDEELLALGAEKSVGNAATDVTEDEVIAWVLSQPAPIKDEWLTRLVREESPRLRAEFWREVRRGRALVRPAAATASSGRTVAELLDALEQRREAAKRREAEKRQRDREAAERKKAAERTKHLDTLVGREATLWREAEVLTATSQPKSYDQAVVMLRDLRDLATRDGQTEDFTKRLVAFRDRIARKRSLIERLNKAGLSG